MKTRYIIAAFLILLDPVRAQDNTPKYSISIRNAQLQALEDTVGPSAVIRLCGGPLPSDVGTFDGGASLAKITLPQDWANVADGTLNKEGVWQTNATITGSPTHIKLYQADGVTPHMQSEITTGAGGIITISGSSVTAGQAVRINDFSIMAGGGASDAPQAATRLQYSVPVQNAMLNTIESVVGPSPIARLITGAVPLSVDEADPGVVVAAMLLPSDWLGASSGGVISKLGTWQDPSADATGAATHITFVSTGAVPHILGDVSGTGGGGLATLSNVNIVAADTVTVSTATITAGNK